MVPTEDVLPTVDHTCKLKVWTHSNVLENITQRGGNSAFIEHYFQLRIKEYLACAIEPKLTTMGLR